MIKICGITNIEEVSYINEVRPDFVGMVLFFPKSKRNISVETARTLLPKYAEGIRKVAVVVSPTLEQVQELENAGFDYIQIHGELSSDVLEMCNLPIIRAYNVTNMAEAQAACRNPKIAGILFDAVTPGSGQVFDWNTVPSFDTQGKLLILAGGLKTENVREAILALKPDCVDVSSGVENDNGIGKNPEKIRSFAAAARAAEKEI